MKDDILITGCGGFIAGAIAKNIINSGEYRTVISIDDFSTGYKESLHNKIKNYQGDCSNKSLIEKVFKTHNIKTVLHFAAQSSGEISFDDPERDLKTNTLSTLHLLDNSVKFKVKSLCLQAQCLFMGIVMNVSPKNQNAPQNLFMVLAS